MIYAIVISNWHPARLNELLNACKWKRLRIKKDDKELVAAYGRDVPKATGKRRVSIMLTLAPRQRAGDPDAYWKSLLDALVKAKLLLDDNRQHCELGTVEFERGKKRETRITLEDIGHTPHDDQVDAIGFAIRQLKRPL